MNCRHLPTDSEAEPRRQRVPTQEHGNEGTTKNAAAKQLRRKLIFLPMHPLTLHSPLKRGRGNDNGRLWLLRCQSVEINGPDEPKPPFKSEGGLFLGDGCVACGT